MHLTKFGFNSLVIVWLIPALLMDVLGNTTATGAESDLFYWKSIFDALLCAYAVWQIFGGEELHTVSDARRRVNDHRDEVVSFENLGALEYIYCGVLVLVALVSWWFHHQVNLNSTGLISIASLVWSWLDIAVAIVSGIQFWKIKSGAVVSLTKRLVE